MSDRTPIMCVWCGVSEASEGDFCQACEQQYWEEEGEEE